MSDKTSALASWTPEQIALGKRWVQAWKDAGAEMEQLRRKEIRQLDTYKTIALLCGPADYTRPPRAPKPSSGLVEQQFLFRTEQELYRGCGISRVKMVYAPRRKIETATERFSVRRE